MSKELLLVMDAVANEKGVPRERDHRGDRGRAGFGCQEALPRAGRADPRRHRPQGPASYETFRRWEVVADDVVMESPDRQIRLMDADDEKRRRRSRRLHRGADREPGLRPHRRPGRQAGHRAARARSRARAGAWMPGRTASASWSTASSSASSAATSTWTWAATPRPSFPRTRRIPRDVLRPGDRVRGYLFDVRTEAARPAAVHQPHRAGIHDGTVQAGSAGSRPGPGRDQGLPRAIRATAPRSPCWRTTTAPIRSAPASACAVRACRPCRNELNGERVDIVLWNDNAGPVRHQRDGAGGSAVDHRR